METSKHRFEEELTPGLRIALVIPQRLEVLNPTEIKHVSEKHAGLHAIAGAQQQPSSDRARNPTIAIGKGMEMQEARGGIRCE
jgi:hypothetical protein